MDGGMVLRFVKSVGAGVMVAAALLLFPQSANANCQLNKVADLPLDLQDGRPRVPVTINEQHGWFTFSNRSNATTLLKDAAQTLGLKPYSTDFFINTGGKKEPVFRAHIKNFQIGDMAPIQVDLFVVDNDHVKSGSWGALSTATFPGVDIDFDYANKRVGLYSEHGCAGGLHAYWDATLPPLDVSRHDVATFQGAINGVPIAVEINSGQKLSTINRSGARLAKLPLSDLPAPMAWINSMNATSSVHLYSGKVAIINKMVVAGESFENIALVMTESLKSLSIPGRPINDSVNYDDTPPQVVLGVDYLLTHHVLISPNQRLAFISSTGANRFQTSEGLAADTAP